MKKLLLFPGLFVCSTYVAGQSTNKAKIDLAYEQCLEENTTTAASRNCTLAAMEKWDAELNKYYKLLMENLSASGQALLRDTQRDWIKFRDKEFTFIHAFYFEEKEGSMWHPVADGEKMKMVKRRALELKDFYETLQD